MSQYEWVYYLTLVLASISIVSIILDSDMIRRPHVKTITGLIGIVLVILSGVINMQVNTMQQMAEDVQRDELLKEKGVIDSQNRQQLEQLRQLAADNKALRFQVSLAQNQNRDFSARINNNVVKSHQILRREVAILISELRSGSRDKSEILNALEGIYQRMSLEEANPSLQQSDPVIMRDTQPDEIAKESTDMEDLPNTIDVSQQGISSDVTSLPASNPSVVAPSPRIRTTTVQPDIRKSTIRREQVIPSPLSTPAGSEIQSPRELRVH